GIRVDSPTLGRENAVRSDCTSAVEYLVGAIEVPMTSRSIPLILLWIVLPVSGVARAQDRPVDEVTQQLFEQYVARQGKINTESVMAATHLVAERGRETGFWKKVLAELRRNNQHSEIGCIRVLGKML